MSKKEKEGVEVEEKIVSRPKYKWTEAVEGEEAVAPIRRQISKTMEVTETFSYYDALAYCMKMEKAVKDKQAEIAGLEAMIKAYRDELEIIEAELKVNEIEKEFQLEVQAKLQEEEKLAQATELVQEIIDEDTN